MQKNLILHKVLNLYITYTIYSNTAFTVPKINSPWIQDLANIISRIFLNTGRHIWLQLKVVISPQKDENLQGLWREGGGAMRPWTPQYPVRTQLVSRTLFEPRGILFEPQPKTVQKIIF